MVDFATPVKEIDTFPHEGGARMVITPSGHYEHLAYQSDKVLTVDVKPLTKEEEQALKKEKFGYTGEKLSLNFQDIEVRAVLQLIADFTGLNMVASDAVAGNVTLRLKNVPWDQALEIILKSKGLGMRQAGNVMMVAPQEEIAAREKLELESQKQIAELAPLKTEFIEVNYAKAADVATLLKTEEGKLLSERGNVSVDQRTNTLLIQETAEKLAEMRKVITTLDVPVRQVLIESRIVIANQDFSRELGVRFGYSKNTFGQNEPRVGNFGAVVGGTQPGDTNFGAGTGFTTPDGLENFIVDLPAATPAGAIGLAVGKIGSYLLQLELSALQVEGRGEVVSSPRVITTDSERSRDRARHRDPLRLPDLQRRHRHRVQEGRAELAGDAAHHPRRPHQHVHPGQQGCGGSTDPARRFQCPCHRYARRHDRGPGRQRRDRGPRWDL